MIGYGLFRTKYGRTNHIYGPAAPVDGPGATVRMRALCGKHDAGTSLKKWAPIYANREHPADVPDNALFPTCKSCRKAAEEMPR